MRKNGFTLIELLAVIVILAIIALIATPIILGIINDAREKANERSVELYASAVKNGIVAYQLREMKKIDAGTYTQETLPFEVEYDGKVECISIILTEDSEVSLEGCKVNDGEKEYSYGTATLVGTMGICNPLDIKTEGAYTAGDKYECDVDPSKKGYDQIFYVLTTITDPKATSVNLIMDSNIRTGGEAVKEENPTDEQKGTVAWVSEADYTREDIGGTQSDYDGGNGDKGPITAIEYLQEATKDWLNTNQQTISTFDFQDDYGNYVETRDMVKTYTINARMPYYSEVSAYNWNTGENAYLYDYLYLDCWDDECSKYDGVNEEGMKHLVGVKGYWISAVDSYKLSAAWHVYFSGSVRSDQYVSEESIIGVRPVINLSI